MRRAFRRAPQPRPASGLRPGGASLRWLRPSAGMVRCRAAFSQLVKDLVANPTVLTGEIAVIVVLSAFFEKLEHWARARLESRDKTGVKILNVLFKEITLLGFVAFALFITLHSGVADRVAEDYPLVATFETVRMMMLMVLLVTITQMASIWKSAQRITREWGFYERSRSFGTNSDSLESRFVQEGYLRRVSDRNVRRGETLVLHRPYVYGTNFFSRIVLRRNPLRKLVMWRAIRHEFLFPSDENVRRVPDPGLFTFEAYLHKRLGKTLISIIEVDLVTWFSTLALLAIPIYFCKLMPFATVEVVQWCFSWFLVVAAVVLVLMLEEDTYRLTPQVPWDVRLILKLFSGESVQMLRRSKLPGWRDRSLSGRRFRPDLGEAEILRGLPKLIPAPARRTKEENGCGTLLSSKTYTRLVCLLAHFQSIAVTTLILSHISRPLAGQTEWALYLLSWAAWPVVLFFLFPMLLRRLTIVSSIELDKDERAIRKVTLETKDALLRDFQRLVQLIGFARRAVRDGEAWTRLEDREVWGRKEMIQALLRGIRLWEGLPEIDKRQIWAVFAGWDATNSGMAETREVEEMFVAMGFPDDAPRLASCLIHMVDFDSTGKLNWMKFKALFGLAAVDRNNEHTKEDMEVFFRSLDVDGNNQLSLFELAEGFERMQISITPDDVANLLFVYFGMAKPEVTMQEFVEWIEADRIAALAGVSEYE